VKRVGVTVRGVCSQGGDGKRNAPGPWGGPARLGGRGGQEVAAALVVDDDEDEDDEDDAEADEEDDVEVDDDESLEEVAPSGFFAGEGSEPVGLSALTVPERESLR